MQRRLEPVYSIDHEGRRYVFVRDEQYTPENSGDPEFGDADLKQEQDKLNSGEWIALGCITYEPCAKEDHCADCSHWVGVESVWGIVIEDTEAAAKATVKEGL